MKNLKPSARIKKRYLLVEAKKEETEKAILEYIGILGWAKASPFFVKSSGDKIILAVSRESLNDIRAAFSINNAKIKIIKVSGTLKGLEK